mmetsp:Transcript_64539/g.120120  ORF Transcript_64539/g.120120 Transcript_64539/m.120120 type:complete len:547 (+) Transcript_64539:131-1771(+)
MAEGFTQRTQQAVVARTIVREPLFKLKPDREPDRERDHEKTIQYVGLLETDEEAQRFKSSFSWESDEAGGVLDVFSCSGSSTVTSHSATRHERKVSRKNFAVGEQMVELAFAVGAVGPDPPFEFAEDFLRRVEAAAAKSTRAEKIAALQAIVDDYGHVVPMVVKLGGEKFSTAKFEEGYQLDWQTSKATIEEELGVGLASAFGASSASSQTTIQDQRDLRRWVKSLKLATTRGGLNHSNMEEWRKSIENHTKLSPVGCRFQRIFDSLPTRTDEDRKLKEKIMDYYRPLTIVLLEEYPEERKYKAPSSTETMTALRAVLAQPKPFKVHKVLIPHVRYMYICICGAGARGAARSSHDTHGAGGPSGAVLIVRCKLSEDAYGKTLWITIGDSNCEQTSDRSQSTTVEIGGLGLILEAAGGALPVVAPGRSIVHRDVARRAGIEVESEEIKPSVAGEPSRHGTDSDTPKGGAAPVPDAFLKLIQQHFPRIPTEAAKRVGSLASRFPYGRIVHPELGGGGPGGIGNGIESDHNPWAQIVGAPGFCVIQFSE